MFNLMRKTVKRRHYKNVGGLDNQHEMSEGVREKRKSANKWQQEVVIWKEENDHMKTKTYEMQ